MDQPSKLTVRYKRYKHWRWLVGSIAVPIAVGAITLIFAGGGPTNKVGTNTGILTQGTFTGTINQTTLIFQENAGNLDRDAWQDIEVKGIPQGIADYVLLTFTSRQGRIVGKARIKGSGYVSAFSTTANSQTPVALRNTWIAAEGRYAVPTILQFSITEKPSADATLSIYTAGWVDTRGTEPH